MKDLSIEGLRNMLRGAVVEVTFRKADGTLRTMLASTNPMYIPDYDPEAEPSGAWSNETLRVIDTELGEWRSFRYDSVLNVFETNMPVLELTNEVNVAA